MRRAPASLRRLEAAHEARETMRRCPAVVVLDYSDTEAVERACASGAIILLPRKLPYD